MKCITCEKEAEFIYLGKSLCKKHFIKSKKEVKELTKPQAKDDEKAYGEKMKGFKVVPNQHKGMLTIIEGKNKKTALKEAKELYGKVSVKEIELFFPK